jgi:RecB family exonuclease
MILAALDRPMSASSISLLLTNPIGWMFRTVLGMAEPDLESEPFRLDPQAFGNLVHGTIERAIRNLGGLIGDATREAIAAAVETGAEETAREFEISVAVPPMRLWRATVARAKTMAMTALAPDFLLALPGQQSFAEVPFGRLDGKGIPNLPWNPGQPLVLSGIKVSGKVDRLDVSGDGRRARVVDWKTGGLPDGADQWTINGGREVQRPIYAGAVRQLMGIENVEAGLAYLRDGAVWVPSADAAAALALLEKRLAAMRAAVANGLLLPGPAAGGDYDDQRFALPGDAKLRYLEEKGAEILKAMGAAADVWGDP